MKRLTAISIVAFLFPGLLMAQAPSTQIFADPVAPPPVIINLPRPAVASTPAPAQGMPVVATVAISAGATYAAFRVIKHFRRRRHAEK